MPQSLRPERARSHSPALSREDTEWARNWRGLRRLVKPTPGQQARERRKGCPNGKRKSTALFADVVYLYIKKKKKKALRSPQKG